MEGRTFREGERIVVKLNSGEHFEGDFVRGTATRIDIDNMHHYESDNRIAAVYCFYQREIHSVYRLNDEKNTEPKEEIYTKPKAKDDQMISLEREEYERLKEMAVNHIYVKTNDKTYYEAVDQISNFESLGVFAIGCERGRSGKISLIVFSTWKQIYIFDIKNFRLQKFPAEIAEILESYYIKKVVHNGGPLRDCLHYSHEVFMKNVFDIQISHLAIRKSSNGKCPKRLRTIGECLTEYFNFPPCLMQSSEESLSESWSERPLSKDKLTKLSRLVTYLITIKEYQMRQMLEKFDKAVDEYHNLFIKSPELKMIERSTSNECTEEIVKLIPTMRFTKTKKEEVPAPISSQNNV